MEIKPLLHILLRGLIIISMAGFLAKPISKEYYDHFYNKALFKVHTTDLNLLSNQLRNRISYFLLMNDIVSLQNVLDSNFGLFGFVITDCPKAEAACPEQQVLFTSNPNLEWRKFPTVRDLANEPFIQLHGASPLTTRATANAKDSGGEFIGRLYILSNIPRSFDEDYGQWLRAPFNNVGPWKYYRKTIEACILGGMLTWLIVELLLRMRRIQLANARQREYELISNADNYLHLLEEKNAQLEEQERYTTRQYENYLNQIRELEQKVKNDTEYQKYTESVIQEIEEAKRNQLQKLTDELSQTKFEMEILRNKIGALEQVSRKEGEAPTDAADKARFANAFEQKLFETIFRSPKYSRGDWRIINSFNVAAGKTHSQFTDCILISKDCLIVLEAKNYPGTIEAEGDVENSKWYAINGDERREIVSLWGDNPFHQVNEYCMSLLRIVQKRSTWNIAVYGVIVFPEKSILSGIGSQIGRFYRTTTIDRLVATLEMIEAEARRHNAFSKRPTPRQLENLIRGRAVGNA